MGHPSIAVVVLREEERIECEEAQGPIVAQALYHCQDQEQASAQQQQLQRQIEQLLWVEKEYEEKVQAHIDRLHRYNEVKDAAQALLGRLAAMRGTTTAELYEEFGIAELLVQK